MKEIIDLTYDIEEGMTTFNAYWHPAVRIDQLGKHNSEGRESRKLILGTHCGTHVDAPSHFVQNGRTIDKIPLHKLMGSITIFDFSHLGKNEVVTREMLEKVNITPLIMFKFGWGVNWKTDHFYRDYPFLSLDAAKYLVERGVQLIATDTPSLDDSRIKLQGRMLGSEEDSPVHKIILRNNLVLVEYIAHLDQVKDINDWNIIVMPIRIKEGDGAPARVCIWK